MQCLQCYVFLQTHNFVSEEIIRMEPDEGLEKLGDALKICAHFKKLYFEKKSQLSVYFKEQPVVEWNFKSSLIFTRMDLFINQMRLIEVRLHNSLYYMNHSCTLSFLI